MAWSEAKWVVDSIIKNTHKDLTYATKVEQGIQYLLVSSEFISGRIANYGYYSANCKLILTDFLSGKTYEFNSDNDGKGGFKFNVKGTPINAKYIATFVIFNEHGNFSVVPEFEIILRDGQLVEKQLNFLQNNDTDFCCYDDTSGAFFKNHSRISFRENSALKILLKGYPPLLLPPNWCKRLIENKNKFEINITAHKMGCKVEGF